MDERTGTGSLDVSEVTRFEVIDYRINGTLSLPGGGPIHGYKGRVLVTGATYGPPVSVELSVEDDGRTLKVFLTDPGDGERVTRPYMVRREPPEV